MYRGEVNRFWRRWLCWTGSRLGSERRLPSRRALLFWLKSCQGEPNFPHPWESKIPHPVQASASCGRTRPAFNFSFNRYELPRMFSVTA
jgi:hypothetical protein